MPAARDLPEGIRALATRNAVRLDNETFASDVERLLSGVERILSTALGERTARQHHVRSPGPTMVEPGPGPRANGSTVQQPTTMPRLPPPRSVDPPVPRPTAIGAPPLYRNAGIGGTGSLPHPPSAAIPPKAGVSRLRVAWRIALWWLVFFWSLITASAIMSVLANPTDKNVGGGIGASVIMCAILGFTAWGLRREIRKQRQLLSAAEGGSQPPDDALSTRHVRTVTAICVVVSVGLGLALALSPPTPTSNGGSPTSVAPAP